jgi:ATP adenylyltransferase
MSLYNFDVARSEQQLQDMRDLDERGICIFCPEQITNDGSKILFKTEHWIIKTNKYPYDHTKLHILLVPKEHVATISKLTKAAQEDFLPSITKCEKKYKLTSYAIGIRSGDMRYNGGSIEHLHAHIVVGDVDDPTHETVRFKMSRKAT